MLEDHADLAPRLAQLRGGQRGEIATVDDDVAFVGRVSRLMVRTSVLLPAPLRPMMPNTSPAGIDRLTLCSASTQPRGPAKRWEILRISIMKKRNGGTASERECAPDKRPRYFY